MWGKNKPLYSPKAMAVHLELVQYPILGRKIRERMREEMFTKGIISSTLFHEEVHEKAMESQARERVQVALEEPEQIWQERLNHIESILTEYYYSLNFSFMEFMGLVEEALADRGEGGMKLLPSFNLELAPWSMLFEQAKLYQKLPSEQRDRVAHRLREIIVVLVKGMLSDQLSFVGIAREVLSIEDLEWIRGRRMGRGKIGGKAAGLTLAYTILNNPEPDDPPGLSESIAIPHSAFLGSDVFAEFLEQNQLEDLPGRKYRSYEANRRDYPEVVKRFLKGRIPPAQRDELRRMLAQVGESPLIVRSSSLLEDNFGIAFAGKYESVFCPNQGTPEQNFEDLCTAIKRVYASALSPDAFVYVRERGLVDYDERMGILIQRVQGERCGKYYFPKVAGVGFSYAPVVWNQRIKREDGFLRIVAGLGTRAVDRVDNDHARMVALSHPTLQPTKSVRETVANSQRRLDVINLENNTVDTIEAKELPTLGFTGLKLVGSVLWDGVLRPAMTSGLSSSDGDIVLTFDGLLKDKRFCTLMHAILRKLERRYGCPVDIEFTVEVNSTSPTGFLIHILQCRQQSKRKDDVATALPHNLPEDTVLFESRRMVADGVIRGVRYIVFVDPEEYRLVSDGQRLEIARICGMLNDSLRHETFVLVGPGRWGSSNRTLGVPVTYADIYNTRALIEIALPFGESPPEASYGTHFFQDLIESSIYPLPIYPEEKDAKFNFPFFRECESFLIERIPEVAPPLSSVVRLLDIERSFPGQRVDVVMSSREDRAVGFLSR